MMIIDVHAHTSLHPMRDMHTTRADLPTIQQFADRYYIDRVVIMATYFPLKKTGLHNRELLSRIQGKKLFLAFLSLDMTNDFQAGLAEIEELAGHDQVVGIKLYPGYQNFDPSGPEASEVYRLAEKLHLPVALHGGSLHHCCPDEQRNSRPLKCGLDSCQLDKLAQLSQPAAFEAAVQKFPEVNFLVSHLGSPHFEQLRDLMRRYPNVYTDISGQFLSGSLEASQEYRETLTKELGQFLGLPNGKERLLLGSDFPILSYADSFDLLRRLRLSPEEARLVQGENAARLLNLKGG